MSAASHSAYGHVCRSHTRSSSSASASHSSQAQGQYRRHGRRHRRISPHIDLSRSWGHTTRRSFEVSSSCLSSASSCSCLLSPPSPISVSTSTSMMMCPDDGDDDDVSVCVLTNKLNIMKGRRRLLVALCTTTSATAAALTSPTRPFSANAADLSLSERMRAPKSLVKPVVVGARPKMTAFPDWLEGTWQVQANFDGYAFPNQKLFDMQTLLRDRDVPGFTKASLCWLADVGLSPASYQVRFTRDDKSGNVYEDRNFNIVSLLDGYLDSSNDKSVVEEMEYSPTDNVNRATLRLRSGVVGSVERIELFTNSREYEQGNNDDFYAAESFRQVNLGYSAQGYGRSAVTNYDYTCVWNYTRQQDDANKASGSLVVAAYLQSNDAERFTARAGSSVPQVNNLLQASTAPCVVYQTSFKMTKMDRLN